MTKQEFTESIKQICPDKETKERMLQQILRSPPPMPQPQRSFHKWNKWLPAAAAALVVLVLGVYALFRDGFHSGVDTAGSYTNATSSAGAVTSDAEIAVVHQFQWDGKIYMAMDEANGQFPSPAASKDIGALIDTIPEDASPALQGCAIYEYIPAQCEAVVAVLQNGSYHLYVFSNFSKYENNSDEDASAYLALYGVKSADDILSLQFEHYPTATSSELLATVENREDIETFYGYFSQLQNSSELYFQRLGIDISPSRDLSIPDSAVSTGNGGWEYDDGSTVTYYPPSVNTSSAAGSAEGFSPVPSSKSSVNTSHESIASSGAASSTASSSGNGTTGLLADMITVRIIFQNGLSMELPYYPHMGFLSRFEMGEDFTQFLDQISHNPYSFKW